MPRRALRCVVDLQLNLVSAPGVWLPCKEDVYLSVSLFNQYRNTRLLTSVFPVLIHEKFRFEKTFYTAVDPAHVADMLADELIIFELVQLSEYSDGACRLASYSTNVRDFLYPYPTLAPSYSSHDREVLMCRTVAFPGISPKLEFSTKTIIKESFSPELDALDDAIAESRSRSKTRRKPTRRARSVSPTRRLTIEDPVDTRPPFVVRKVIREPYTDPLPVYKSKIIDDLDLDVTATTPTYRSLSRSKSPLSYRASFLERYGYDPLDPLRPYYYPYYYSRTLALERELERKRRLSRVYDTYYKSIDDLDLELRLARLRANRLLL